MKKILLLLLLSIFYLCSFSQQTFSDTIKIKDAEYSSNTIIASNNDLIASVNTSSGVYIFRTDNSGNLKWEKLYGTNSYYQPILCSTKDNGFICYCDIFDSALSTHQISLIKCDSLGNIQWSRSIGTDYTNNYIYLGQVITNSKQEYIVTYESDSKIFPFPETFQLLKFNKSGNLIFQTGYKNIFGRDYQGLELNSVIETFNGGYLIGFSYENADADGPPNGYFLFTNSAGDPISYKAFGPSHTDFSDYDNQLELFKKDDKYYVLGFYDHWTGSHYEPHYYITSFKDNTSIIKGKFIEYNAFALQRFVIENKIPVKQLDKYIIDKKSISYINLIKGNNLIGYTFSFNKYDSLGRICPNYTLPIYDSSSSLENINFGKDIKGVIKNLDTIVITTNGIGEKSIHYFTQGCVGETNNFIKNDLAQNASSVAASLLFPNPAHNTITVSIPSLNKQTQISLFNSNGKLLQLFQVYSKTSILNIENYSKGIYVVKISNTDQTQILKFIKQ